jgi:hypothetical protein
VGEIVTGTGLSVEALAWSLFAAALLAFFTGQVKLALGMGLPGLCLAGIEWIFSASAGGGEPAHRGVPAALPPTLPTFVVVFVACLGLWAAHARWRRDTTRGRVTEFPYPDLASGKASPGHGAVLGAVEPLGRWDGRQWDRQCARLADLTRDFLGYVVPRPGQPAKIDTRDPDVLLMIDSLLEAADLVVGASGDDDPQILADAIREIEWRWIMIRHRRDLAHRAGAGADAA